MAWSHTRKTRRHRGDDSGMKGLTMHRFPDFDKDVRRPFAVDEQCYDCSEFYDGCNARPTNPPTRCRDYLRLPDVMPGTTGQRIPASRMGGRKEPRLCREETTDHQEPARTQRKPVALPTGPRLCGCGAILPKGKRLCDGCRTDRRRQTLREYKRRWRAESSGSHPVSDIPSTHAATPSAQGRGDDLPPVGHPAGVGRFGQTSVGQNPTLGGEQP